jgi:predicted DNA-binding transcriptional regulator YafY
MSKRSSLTRYNLIIKKLRKYPASFTEIADYLERESELQDDNFNVSRRTFQRDLEDIRLLYGIDIQYDFSKKVYYIDIDERSEIAVRVLEAFDIFNAMNLTDRLLDYIHFEKRKPQGTENFYELLLATKNRVQIQFSYQKFWDDEKTQRLAEPYALKEFKNRWYLLANDLKDHRVKSFALDRLSDLEITKKQFQLPADFNINEYYRNCFGIISPNQLQPEEVILSFDPYQGKYVKTLPLHESQQILIDNEEELRIKLSLFITYDFVMEMLSYGDNVRVIQPESLINDLKSIYQRALEQYDEQDNEY